MSDRVPELAARAVNERSRELLLQAFLAAGTQCAAEQAKGDVRNGLIAMVLPFDAAARIGADADALVEEATARLEPAAAELLRTFAARADRAGLAPMKWRVVTSDDATIEYRFHW